MACNNRWFNLCKLISIKEAIFEMINAFIEQARQKTYVKSQSLLMLFTAILWHGNVSILRQYICIKKVEFRRGFVRRDKAKIESKVQSRGKSYNQGRF
jgi:hypothetical protein